jgi:hypothetical protein
VQARRITELGAADTTAAGHVPGLFFEIGAGMNLTTRAAVRRGLIVVALTLATAGAALCVTDSWTQFHHDKGRSGWNGVADKLDSLNTNSQFGLVYTFPMPTANAGSELVRTVDDGGVGFTFDPGWTASIPNDPYDPLKNANNGDFMWQKGKAPVWVNGIPTPPASPSVATWNFPAIPPGEYKVFAWFPSGPLPDPTPGAPNPGPFHTTKAQYTVTSADGVQTFEVDQTNGGNWVEIGTRGFAFTSGVGHSVTLSDYTPDYDPVTNPASKPVIACADAVLFVPTLNQKVYSSAATLLKYQSPVNMPNYLTGWEAKIGEPGIPVAYIGTVDTPRWAADSNTVYGSMYCVNSDVAQRTDATHPTGFWFTGHAIWKYPTPVSPSDPLYTDAGGTLFANPRGRDPLEGPIQGGIYGSPAVAGVDTNSDSIADTWVVYFTGMDRQIYAVDAYSGRLIWRGPGQTVSEQSSSSWPQEVGREDAFGGKFLRINASEPPATGTSSNYVSWTGPDSSIPQLFNSGTGRYFSIYVWLPRKQAADPERVQTASYEVTYSVPNASGTAVSTTKTVVVNQFSASGAGQWVKLGDSFFNPTSVKLFDTSSDWEDPDTHVRRDIVADAIEFIPSALQEFSYSSPAIAGSVSNPVVVAGNVNGRVYALSGLPVGGPPGTTMERWVFPEVQSVLVATPTSGADQPALGPVVASPAIYNDTAYIPSMDGRVYRIGGILGGSPTYDETIDQFPGKADTAKGGFSSSPAVDTTAAGDLYVASVDGELFKLSGTAGSNLGSPMWTFPGNAGTTEGASTTVGAFRYSSPSVDSNGVYVGSTDGHIYALNKDGTYVAGWNWGLTTDLNDPLGTSQILSGPIQSSLAIDHATIPALFCGTMNGDVWWLSGATGAFAQGNSGKHIGDMVFSSPAVAQVTDNDAYMYVGSDDGRLYAFSTTVHGGGWTGDDIGIDEPGNTADLKQPDPVNSVQAQVVDGGTPTSTFARILNAPAGPLDDDNPLLNIIYPKVAGVRTAQPQTDAKDGHRIGRALRTQMGLASNLTEVIYEWGENINVVVWNLNKKADIETIRIELFSSSRRGGTNSDGQINPGSGGVESGSAPKAATLNSSSCIEYKGQDSAGVEVDKSYVTHEFHIPRDWLTSNSGRPPGAGSAWIINVTVRVKGSEYTDSNNVKRTSPSTSEVGIVPELDVNGVPQSATRTIGASAITRYKPQYISVNNPLAIKANIGLAWPISGYLNPSRTDPYARVNGAGAKGIVGGSNFDPQTPLLDLGMVNHGTNSELYLLGVMDRSPMGIYGQSLDKFRVDASDLYWRGGEGAVVNKLPWDFPPTNYSSEQQLFSGLASPYVGAQKDYPDIRERYESFKKLSDGGNPVRGNTKLIPAHLPNSGGPPDHVVVPDPLQVYVDVPRFQPANTMGGYSATMQAYLDTINNGTFDDGNVILGQPTAYVEPYRPFRVRVGVAADYRVRVEESVIDLGKAPHGLGHHMDLWDPFEVAPNPAAPWFREFTVKNLGNVNILNVEAAPLGLGSPQSGVPLAGFNIITSLAYPPPVANPAWASLGHTISKARVGDPEPTTLTIPDSRPYEWMFNAPSFSKPKVGLIAPLTQPIGTYAGIVPIRYGDPGALRYAEPTFVLKATVREDRMTGGAVAGALPQVDDPSVSATPAIGDVQPAVFRDINPKDLTEKGSAHMFWSSNRDPKTPAPVDPNAPWYIYEANLKYDLANGWSLGIPNASGVPGRWWATAMGAPSELLRIPSFEWPPASGVAGTIVPNTHKHLAPSIAQDQLTGQTWLFWQGQVSRTNNGQLTSENRLFYTDVTKGATSNPVEVSITSDFAMIKYAPRAVAYTEAGNSWLWAFYYGGDAGRWSIFYNAHKGAASGAHDPSTWSRDAKLPTPGSLSSVSEPMAVARLINDKRYLDVTYTGVSKQGQNSDIYMSRYGPIDPNTTTPSLRQVAFPRVRGELMASDDKRGISVSKHIWWTRPRLNAGDIVVKLPSGTVLDATDPAGATIEIDRATGVYVITYDATSPCYIPLRQTIIDPGSGTVRFRTPLPAKAKVVVSYTPMAMRLSGSADSDTSPFVVLDKTPDTMWTIGPSSVTAPGPVDRLWLFWRKPASGVRATTVFYRTMRLGVQLSKPIRNYASEQVLPASSDLSVNGNNGPFEIDWTRGRVYFTEKDERYPGLSGSPGPITVSYKAVDPSDPTNTNGVDTTDTFDTVSWRPELAETALLGNAAEAMVNEGQVCAFPEPEVLAGPGTGLPLGAVAGKMWVFWTSTRTGQTDIFYETVSPVFRQ